MPFYCQSGSVLRLVCCDAVRTEGSRGTGIRSPVTVCVCVGGAEARGGWCGNHDDRESAAKLTVLQREQK